METNEMTVISAAGPEDLIATVWYSLGYRPEQSLVFVGLEGARRRVGMMLRTDLPPLPSGPLDLGRRLPPGLLPDLVRSCLTTVAGSGADAVLVIIADEQALTPASRPVIVAVQHQVREVGLQLLDVLAVTSTAFGSLLCPDPRCCPAGGRPIDEVLSSRGAVAHIMNGQTVAETETGLVDDVRPAVPDESAVPDNSAVLDEPAVLDEGAPGSSGGDVPSGQTDRFRWRERLPPAQRLEWWNRWGEACARAMEYPSGDHDPLQGLSAALHDWHLRDALLVELLGATPREIQGMLNGEYGQYDESIASEVSAPQRPEQDLGRLFRQQPDADQLEVARRVLASAVRVARAGDRGPGLAVLAMLAWLEGKGTRSRLLAEQARADSPTVSLTGLVEDLLFRRVAPPWRRAGPEG